MSQPTQNTYKRSFAGSVGAGMGSLFNASGKKYFILEHKVSSKYHRAGESQQIIVDQIELGRDDKCQVRFDESFTTVSRRHAAIVRDGDNWKLIQLSKTNTTFLNGHPVKNEWYLQNGDEIQLSVNGPKLGFIIPSGEKSTVKSINFTARMNLFAQQALRPYKTAVAVLAVVLLLSLSGGGYAIWAGHNIKVDLEDQLVAIEREQAIKDSIAQEEMERLIANNDSISKLVGKLSGEVKKAKNFRVKVSEELVKGEKDLEACVPYVYFIWAERIVITFEGQTKEVDGGWSGTGFIDQEGRFITARHVIEPWFFAPETELLQNANVIASNGGTVIAYFKAYSSSGDVISFKSSQFKCNRSKDDVRTVDGMRIRFAGLNDTDYAYYNTGRVKGLHIAPTLSEKLPRGAKLSVLGFPLGLGANSESEIRPQFSSATTSDQGLNNGIILTTETTYEQGNSGGPVFCANADGSSYTVVGIVSAGAGRSTGFVVPISAIK